MTDDLHLGAAARLSGVDEPLILSAAGFAGRPAGARPTEIRVDDARGSQIHDPTFLYERLAHMDPRFCFSEALMNAAEASWEAPHEDPVRIDIYPANFDRLSEGWCVQDNACGMDEDTLEKLLHYGATTKPTGEGRNKGVGITLIGGYFNRFVNATSWRDGTAYAGVVGMKDTGVIGPYAHPDGKDVIEVAIPDGVTSACGTLIHFSDRKERGPQIGHFMNGRLLRNPGRPGTVARVIWKPRGIDEPQARIIEGAIAAKTRLAIAPDGVPLAEEIRGERGNYFYAVLPERERGAVLDPWVPEFRFAKAHRHEICSVQQGSDGAQYLRERCGIYAGATRVVLIFEATADVSHNPTRTVIEGWDEAAKQLHAEWRDLMPGRLREFMEETRTQRESIALPSFAKSLFSIARFRDRDPAPREPRPRAERKPREPGAKKTPRGPEKFPRHSWQPEAELGDVAIALLDHDLQINADHPSVRRIFDGRPEEEHPIIEALLVVELYNRIDQFMARYRRRPDSSDLADIIETPTALIGLSQGLTKLEDLIDKIHDFRSRSVGSVAKS